MTDEPITVTLTNDAYQTEDDPQFWEWDRAIDWDAPHAVVSRPLWELRGERDA